MKHLSGRVLVVLLAISAACPPLLAGSIILPVNDKKLPVHADACVSTALTCPSSTYNYPPPITSTGKLTFNVNGIRVKKTSGGKKTASGNLYVCKQPQRPTIEIEGKSAMSIFIEGVITDLARWIIGWTFCILVHLAGWLLGVSTAP